MRALTEDGRIAAAAVAKRRATAERVFAITACGLSLVAVFLASVAEKPDARSPMIAATSVRQEVAAPAEIAELGHANTDGLHD